MQILILIFSKNDYSIARIRVFFCWWCIVLTVNILLDLIWWGFMFNNIDNKDHIDLIQIIKKSFDFFHCLVCWPPCWSIGPSGQSIAAQVSQTSDGLFKADFVPRSVGEHRVSVTVKGQPTAGSPYAAKVRYKLSFNLFVTF